MLNTRILGLYLLTQGHVLVWRSSDVIWATVNGSAALETATATATDGGREAMATGRGAATGVRRRSCCRHLHGRLSRHGSRRHLGPLLGSRLRCVRRGSCCLEDASSCRRRRRRSGAANGGTHHDRATLKSKEGASNHG